MSSVTAVSSLSQTNGLKASWFYSVCVKLCVCCSAEARTAGLPAQCDLYFRSRGYHTEPLGLRARPGCAGLYFLSAHTLDICSVTQLKSPIDLISHISHLLPFKLSHSTQRMKKKLLCRRVKCSRADETFCEKLESNNTRFLFCNDPHLLFLIILLFLYSIETKKIMWCIHIFPKGFFASLISTRVKQWKAWSRIHPC